MQLTIPLITLGLALTASANVNGMNPISIFQYGDPAACRQLFYQYGACGLSTYQPNTDPNMPLVAIPGLVFDQYGASQNNQLCGKVITMTHDGITQQALVADQNVGGDNSVDVCLNTWEAFGGHDGDGSIIRDMHWEVAL